MAWASANENTKVPLHVFTPRFYTRRSTQNTCTVQWYCNIATCQSKCVLHNTYTGNTTKKAQHRLEAFTTIQDTQNYAIQLSFKDTPCLHPDNWQHIKSKSYGFTPTLRNMSLSSNPSTTARRSLASRSPMELITGVHTVYIFFTAPFRTLNTI